MNRERDKILQSPSTLRIRLSRHLAFSYLTQAAFYMVLVIAWLYWYVTYIWNRIGPDSGGRIELPIHGLFHSKTPAIPGRPARSNGAACL